MRVPAFRNDAFEQHALGCLEEFHTVIEGLYQVQAWNIRAGDQALKSEFALVERHWRVVHSWPF